MSIHTFKLLCALTMGLASFAAPAAYPEKPIKFIVPFPAGGPSDTVARIVGQSLTKSLKQQILVENLPGAGGAIAARAVMRAPADGYTFLWTSASMAAIPLLQKDSPFKSLTEFAPVSLIGRFGFGLFVYPGIPAASVAELVAFGKANPEKLAYASGALSEYMVTTQFMKLSGLKMLRIPYKGASQAMPDLVAGRVQVYFTPISLGLPHVMSGQLRMLATLSPERSPLAPAVPTLAEAGIAGIALPTWQGILAPPKLPKEIAAKMAREVVAALHDPETQSQLERQALSVEAGDPDTLATVIDADADRWLQFVRDNDIPKE